jgi:hypothetical protein
MNHLPEILLIAGGLFNIGLAVFYLFFWKVFHWKKDLAKLTSVNRAIMQTLNICLIFVFLMMAYVSFFHRAGMLSTNLGNSPLIFFSLGWFLLAVEQVIFFKIKHRVSLVFTFIFLVGSTIYLLPTIVK